MEVFRVEDGTTNNSEIENMNDAIAKIYVKGFVT